MEYLFENGTILTMEERMPAAQALLVRDGRIAAVGAREAVAAQASGDAERVDLAGRTVMPAFLDPHSHFFAVANGFLQVSLEGCASWADIAERIQSYIRDNHVPAGEWVRAQGYDHNALAEGRHPDRQVLDVAAPEHPVILQHQSGHMGVFNTLALERLGVTEKTPCPEGGAMGREGGALTGYMEENAFLLWQRKVPMPDMAALTAACEKAQALYASCGITTVQEGMLPEQLVPIYQALCAGDKLYLDVVGYADSGGMQAAERLLPECLRGYFHHFRVAGYKIFLDGSPQGRTAWLRKPYAGEKDYRGYGTMTDEQVLSAFRTAVSQGRQLLSHCNGDAAAEQYLRAIAQVEKEGLDAAAIRPVMIHAQLLGLDQLPELKRLGVLPSFFVAHVYHWGDVHVKNLGPERAAPISPAGSAARLGIPFTFHQDAPVIRPDMLETVWCAVERRMKDGSVLGPEERVDVWTALKAVTANAAYQYFEEDQKGTLAPGKQADLVVLDRDPTRTAGESLRTIRVLETWKDGVRVFER